MLENYLPILLQILVATGFAGATLLVSVLLGKAARSNTIKDSAYECGMLPIGEAQPRFSVKFYIVAMLFVLFDIEVVFLYPWPWFTRTSLRRTVQPSSAPCWASSAFWAWPLPMPGRRAR